MLKKGKDFVGVSVVFFCHNGKGEFLMAQRSQNARDEKGNWDIGAGALEVGDSVEVTLKKEIKEEYCTEVLEYNFLGFRDVFRQDESGTTTHWITLDFKVLINPETVAIGEPHKFSNFGWFKAKNLPSPLHSQVVKFFEKYKAQL